MHLWSHCQSWNPDQTQKTQRNNMICSKNIFIVFRLIWKRRLSQQQLSDHPGLINRLVRLIWANVSFYWSINAEPSTTSSWFQCLLFINVMFSLTQLKYLSLPPRRNLARIQVVYSDTMWPEVIPSAWILGPRETAHTVHVWRKRAWQQLIRKWGHDGFWVCCFCLARQVPVSQIRCYFKSVGFSSLLFFGSSPSSNRWMMIFWESLINTQQNYFKIMRANLISNR